MHGEVERFVARVLPEIGGIAGKRVLEFGSYDVNGNLSNQLEGAAAYVGVDHRSGPNVTHVSLFHEFQDEEGFDVLLCVNTLEHDPYWQQSIANGLKLLKPGGCYIMSVPWGHVEHELECSPNSGYYANIPPEELKPLLPGLCHFSVEKDQPDTFVWGIKP